MGLPQQEYWDGCHFLLQWVFLTQGLNLSPLRLLRWQVDAQDSNRTLWIASSFSIHLSTPLFPVGLKFITIIFFVFFLIEIYLVYNVVIVPDSCVLTQLCLVCSSFAKAQPHFFHLTYSILSCQPHLIFFLVLISIPPAGQLANWKWILLRSKSTLISRPPPP